MSKCGLHIHNRTSLDKRYTADGFLFLLVSDSSSSVSFSFSVILATGNPLSRKQDSTKPVKNYYIQIKHTTKYMEYSLGMSNKKVLRDVSFSWW